MKFRIFVFTALAGMAATPVLAQDLRGQLSHCLGVQGVLQRLACYDGVARGAGAQPPYQASQAPYQPNYAAPVPVPGAPPPPPRYVAPTLGAERLPQNAPGAPERAAPRMVVGIVKFENTLRGKFILTLANGQIWRQIDSDISVARPRNSARTVIIESALFNSYTLTFNDATQTYKVTRVQ